MLPTANYKAWKIHPDQFPTNGSLAEQLRFLLGYAVLAPSSHNAQPWKFKIENNVVLVLADKDRAVPLADPDERLLHIALGAAIENLLVAADYFSFASDIFYFPGGECVAKIIFSKTSRPRGGTDHLIFAIPKRHTHRGEYTAGLPPAFISWAVGLGTSDLQVMLVTDNARRDALADIITRARVEEMDYAPFRAEMARYKRSNLTLAGVGITGETMGFSLIKSLVSPFALRKFNVLKMTQKEDVAMLKKHTPGIGVIVTEENNRKAWLMTGRIFERIAVKAEQEGLRTNVTIAAVCYGDYYKKAQQILRITKRPQLFFRIGKTSDRWPHSPRLSVSEVLAS